MQTLKEAQADFRAAIAAFDDAESDWNTLRAQLQATVDDARDRFMCAARRATTDGCEGCDVCQGGGAQ